MAMSQAITRALARWIRPIIATLLVLVGLPVFARGEIRFWVDADDTTHFSNDAASSPDSA